VLSLIPLAQYRMYQDHMDNGWGWGMGALMLIAVVAVVVLVVWVVHSTGSHHASPAPAGLTGAASETPAQILDRRLAQGDITPEDYQARAAILNKR